MQGRCRGDGGEMEGRYAGRYRGGDHRDEDGLRRDGGHDGGVAADGLLVDKGGGHVGAADLAAALVEPKLAEEVVGSLRAVCEAVRRP